MQKKPNTGLMILMVALGAGVVGYFVGSVFAPNGEPERPGREPTRSVPEADLTALEEAWEEEMAAEDPLVETPDLPFGDTEQPSREELLHSLRGVTGNGETPEAQSRAGRYELLGMSFEDYEREIRRHLSGMLGPGGFDPAEDIAAITVNRWPHGYAWNPNPLFNPEYPPGQAPHEIGRQPFGRIHIANSDAGARAYLDCAIDEAWRAVQESL